VETRFLDAYDLGLVEKKVAELRPRAVMVETISNPLLRVADIGGLAEITRAAGAALIVDNTFGTPYLQRPLDLGADIVVHSATKYLSGHGDLTAGVVVAGPPFDAAVESIRKLVGGVLGPFEAWLAHRSLATLGLRLERQQANARALVDALEGRVTHLRWPGIGPVISFALPNAQDAQAFLDECRLVSEATSFGGVHSTAERRARWGTDDVPDGFIRFSCGIEDTEDLVADVLQALAR
jgi:cystathionine beta-lyase/cystathionine gamma-synthase